MKKLNIIYEDKELLVVEKESHLLTIATEKRESRTLYNVLFSLFSVAIVSWWDSLSTTSSSLSS